MTNIKPLGTLVLIKKMQQEDRTTQTGLFMPSSVLENDTLRGEVIAVGDGTRDIQGNLHPLNVVAGDIVYFNENSTTEVVDDQGETYQFIAFSNLFGKITNA